MPADLSIEFLFSDVTVPAVKLCDARLYSAASSVSMAAITRGSVGSNCRRRSEARLQVSIAPDQVFCGNSSVVLRVAVLLPPIGRTDEHRGPSTVAFSVIGKVTCVFALRCGVNIYRAARLLPAENALEGTPSDCRPTPCRDIASEQLLEAGILRGKAAQRRRVDHQQMDGRHTTPEQDFSLPSRPLKVNA